MVALVWLHLPSVHEEEVRRDSVGSADGVPADITERLGITHVVPLNDPLLPGLVKVVYDVERGHAGVDVDAAILAVEGYVWHDISL